jgi:GNAT superfamily N-acetyltransferase
MVDDIICQWAEAACLNAWPAIEEVFYDDWLIRFAAGQTRRTNSVNVIGPGRFAVDTKIVHCEQIYRACGQPAYFRILPMRDGDLDSRLAERGYSKEGETLTLFMDFAQVPPAVPDQAVELHEELPTREWRQAHIRLSGRTRAEGFVLHDILNLLALPAAFAAVRNETGAIASVAFGAIHAGMVCLQWVVTAEAARRRGYSRATILALLGWAARAGASGACLQVVAENFPAINLYSAIGFDRELYRYHYRVA